MADKAEQSKDGFMSRLNPFKKNYSSLTPNRGGFFHWIVGEANSGDWQKNIEWKRECVLAYHAIFACIGLISSDIAKLAIKLVREDSNGIWNDVPLGNFSVLDKPNPYQNRIQFIESWLISKLSRGNTYALKTRNSRGIVTRIDILNPDFVMPLVSPSGEVFYQLSADNLTGIEQGVTVPDTEIIHDRFNCLFHPLIGLSPIFACGLAAWNGLQIQKNSATHFGNMSKPGGIITAPGAITEENAKLIKQAFEQNYGGKNYGKTAVLGDDLKYTPIGFVSAVDSQMVEQLRLNADIVCSTFHVPAYKVIGNAPAYNNIEAQEAAYYSQCLQILIESIELCLDEGLEVPDDMGVEFALTGLLRMDTKTQVETLGAGVNKAIYAPNEARKMLNLKPVVGGNSPMIQQQNFSLEALSKRDSQVDPFGTTQPAPAEPEPVIDEEKQLLQFSMMLRKELKGHEYA